MAPAPTAVEVPVEVDASLALECGMPVCSAAELAVDIPLVAGGVQPSWVMAPSAIDLQLDASPALQCEVSQYGASVDAGWEANKEKVEAAVNIQASFDLQE